MARTTSMERLVEGLEGSTEAKKRLKAILANLAGASSVGEAGESVGIGAAMFHRERTDALQGALAALEPRRVGRPREEISAEELRVRALQEENDQLRLELTAARIREEIAVAMPHLLVRGKGSSAKKAAAVGAEEGSAPTATPVRVGHETRHWDRLLTACRLHGREKKPCCARGSMMQQDLRASERSIRKAAVAFGRWALRLGESGRESARRLGIADATLRKWVAQWQQCRMRAEPRGAPSRFPDATTRTAMLVVFYLMGVGVGVPTMQAVFPDVTRAAIENLLRRYRKLSARRKRRMVRWLRWRASGRVWAMDYAQAPRPIDGSYPWFLAVRDLSSGYVLCALPVAQATAAQTRAALQSLFTTHGAPLVIKSDNGSHFTGGGVPELLEEHGVIALLSPPGLPEYNGAIEAGIGSLIIRAHHLSARHGRPGEWTCDDLEGARLQANLTGRPRGHAGTTPALAWEGRTALTPEERHYLACGVARMRDVVRLERGYFLRFGPLDEMTNRALERMAVVRALIECEHLEIRRSRIPLLSPVAVRA